MTSKIIIDVDTGVDDAQAIMMATSCENANIVAVTCVTGNMNVDQVSTNTLRVLRACDRLDVPVYKGSFRSMLGTHTDSAYHHGNDGMGGVPDPDPPSHGLIQPGHAAGAMIDIVNRYPGEVTLVGLAPLTNVALAIRLEPTFGSKLKKAVIMGGNIQGKGNQTPSGEFNFWHDPEAAHVVLHELECPITLLPMETCRASRMEWEWFDDLLTWDTKKGRFHAAIMQYATHRRKEVLKMAGYIAYDPVTMAVALEQTVATRVEGRYCAVELHGHLTRGQMVVDWNEILGKQPNVDIVMEVDVDRIKEFHEMMLKAS